jgi:hypothetical protein
MSSISVNPFSRCRDDKLPHSPLLKLITLSRSCQARAARDPRDLRGTAPPPAAGPSLLTIPVRPPDLFRGLPESLIVASCSGVAMHVIGRHHRSTLDEHIVVAQRILRQPPRQLLLSCTKYLLRSEDQAVRLTRPTGAFCHCALADPRLHRSYDSTTVDLQPIWRYIAHGRTGCLIHARRPSTPTHRETEGNEATCESLALQSFLWLRLWLRLVRQMPSWGTARGQNTDATLGTQAARRP